MMNYITLHIYILFFFNTLHFNLNIMKKKIKLNKNIYWVIHTEIFLINYLFFFLLNNKIKTI